MTAWVAAGLSVVAAGVNVAVAWAGWKRDRWGTLSRADVARRAIAKGHQSVNEARDVFG